jgi:HAE1 family hydrophobic/amphiphilic exporter-1
MVAGMLPIALAQGAGAEWKNGLAWVLIGGLLSSMFLTLVIVPLVYYLMDRVMMRFGWDKKARYCNRRKCKDFVINKQII